MKLNRYFSIYVMGIILLPLLGFIFYFPPSIRNGFFLSFALSALNAFLIFVSLNWTWDRSDKIFYGTFFGGIVWKLIVLALMTYLIYRNPDFNLNATLISFVFLTFLFNFTGISFLSKRKELAVIHGF